MASGKFELAPAVENMEVSAAMVGRAGHSNNDLSSHANRKRQAPGGHSIFLDDNEDSCFSR